MEKKINISCLPVAGIENPYQFLMIEGLKSDLRLEVKNGIDDRFFGILRTAFTQKPDYIHFDWETTYYYRKNIVLTLISIPIFIFQVLFVKYILRCKLVWTPHNLVPHDAEHITIHHFCRKFFAKQMNWIRVFDIDAIERASKVFNISRAKFVSVPEGSYVDYYSNEIDDVTARKLLGIPLNKKVILYLGLIKPYKGVLDLVKAFNKIKDKEDCILLLAGKSMDKEYLDEIKNNLNSNIILNEGFINDNDLQIYFNASDVVALPFENIENSGSVILAMGFGKPIIAPNKGVCSKRLFAQRKLLYSTEKISAEFLTSILKISKNSLCSIGNENKKNVLKFEWNNISTYFN